MLDYKGWFSEEEEQKNHLYVPIECVTDYVTKKIDTIKSTNYNTYSTPSKFMGTLFRTHDMSYIDLHNQRNNIVGELTTDENKRDIDRIDKQIAYIKKIENDTNTNITASNFEELKNILVSFYTKILNYVTKYKPMYEPY